MIEIRYNRKVPTTEYTIQHRSKIQSLLDKATIVETGRVQAFRELSIESGLMNSLCHAFGNSEASKIFAIATFQASEGMPLYLAADFADDTGIEEGLSSSNISKVVSKIGLDDACINRFFVAWIKECGKPKSVVHDTTSISSYSSKCEEVEWGYNRDGEKLAQINLSLVAARESRLPLWYRLIPGSIPDVSSLKLTCKILTSLGLKDFSFSLDRGYFSSSNISELRKTNIGFTIGLPHTNKQYKQLVRENLKYLEMNSSSFLAGKKVMRHALSTIAFPSGEKSPIILPAHVFLDTEKREVESRLLEMNVLELQAKAANMEFKTEQSALIWIEENSGPMAKLFETKKSGMRYCVVKNVSEVQDAINSMGMFIIVKSKEGDTASEVLSEYKCRDLAEKIFDNLKNGIGFERFRTSKSEQINGRAFIAFVSVILRVLFENKLRSAGLLSKYTVDEALSKLRKIKQLLVGEIGYVPKEIPKQSREIFSAICKK